MRGTEATIPQRDWWSRFSPARAGNGRRRLFHYARRPVQPRACGERSSSTTRRTHRRGSAPRVRGTVDRGPVAEDFQRFSPARAGNGRRRKPTTINCSVQPRACGERSVSKGTPSVISGSAPRVRGTGCPSLLYPPRRRFSPARAGNGKSLTIQAGPEPVQPRACGERSFALARYPRPIGSAPRVRGTVRLPDFVERNRRFSPARAGNGYAQTPIKLFSTVQPRACGERAAGQEPKIGDLGSAPRVRGTVRCILNGCRYARFSPARAGNGAPA